MQLLASVAMRGRAQGVMLASVLAMLSLLMPPVSILSSAVIALITLRKGYGEGLWTLLLSSLACGLLALMLVGSMEPVVGFLLAIWLPIWLLAWLFRAGRSLTLTTQAALLLGMIVIIGQYLVNDDPTAAWREALAPFTDSLVETGIVDQEQSQPLLEMIASWMTGWVAVGFFLQTMASLLLARWWQAMLFNPGGFSQEFRQLRLHRLVAVATLVVVGAWFLSGFGEPGFAAYLVMLLGGGWFLQGLSLAHATLGPLKSGVGWLAVMYVLLLFAMQYMFTVLAAAGFADAWFNFRARLKTGQGTGGAG